MGNRAATNPGGEVPEKATAGGRNGATGNAPVAPYQEPRSLAISSRGVKTGEDFANLMSAMMSDVIDGRINPAVANAACNAGGKLLKAVEMQYRYGKQSEQREPTLTLAPGG